MTLNTEQDIDKLLNRMKIQSPEHKPSADFEHTWAKMTVPVTDRQVPFLQLRNTGLALLLVVAVNLILLGASNLSANKVPEQTKAVYLQPYNLNIY
ncbi:MAG: hypothetical protein EOP49_17525 [Sphingobacteriales bacterium]|nr:MAG: hypothetical protein EOP49_17525 [Sphingobacteriales bacterium]